LDCIQGFDSKNFKQDLEVDGLVGLIVKCFLQRIYMDRIHLAHDRYQWRALVKAEVNSRI